MRRCVFALSSILTLAGMIAAAPLPRCLLVSSIGFPTKEYQSEAWSINVLRLFDNRLYIGYGDYGVNTGPTDVLYYDFATNRFEKEFTVQEEAIAQYQVVDGALVIPGVDATEEWDFGNVYVRGDSSWAKYRSIPSGLHVFDVVSHGGKWFVGTGNYCRLTESDEFAPGAILSTSDSCRTWQYEYLTPCSRQDVYRFSALISFKDRLYTFPYAYRWLPEEEIPPGYRQYLSDPFSDGDREGYLVSVDSPFGDNDAVCYDGSSWKQVQLVPDSCVYRTRPAVFRDHLILSTVSGRWINAPSVYLSTHGALPGNVRTGLFAFDGERAERIDFHYELIRDVLAKPDTLYVLYHDRGEELIATTADLVSWRYYRLPSALTEPRSLECDGRSFYIGMADGNVFRSDGFEAAEIGATPCNGPLMFWGAAESSRQSRRYWAALGGWTTLGRLASYSCGLGPGNDIIVSTENVSELQLFPAEAGVDASRPLTVTIDGQMAYFGRVRSELVCRVHDGSWQVRAGNGTASSLTPIPIVIGSASVDVTRKVDDPASGAWQAAVFRWAGAADIGLAQKAGLRRDIRKGEITLDDAFAVNYRNDIRTFRATGSEIGAMLQHNVMLPDDRCQIAGFTMRCEIHKDLKENHVVLTSLDPEHEYLVATSSYITDNAPSILGRDVAASTTGMTVVEAMVRWLRQFKTIEETPTACTFEEVE